MPADRLSAVIEESAVLAPVLARWDEIDLPDCWLVAGCVAQSVWNDLFGLPPEHGLSDIDVVYFDPLDLSVAAEERVAQRLRDLFGALPVDLDIKNQARVHCWYETKFGFAAPPYRSTCHAISTFPTTATSVGVRPDADGLEWVAPFGTEDLSRGIVRANRSLAGQDVFLTKTERWSHLWPDLTVLPWEEGVG